MSFAARCEDSWILAQFPRDFDGFAADIGAADGLTLSNTLALDYAGWKVLCVEPNPFFSDDLKLQRRLVEICACGSAEGDEVPFHVNDSNQFAYSGLEGPSTHPVWRPEATDQFSTISVRVERLDSLLERQEFPRLDVLSVDTEGTELEVLKGLDLSRWKPKVIISECWDEDGGPVLRYLAERGYVRTERRQVNDLYVFPRWLPEIMR